MCAVPHVFYVKCVLKLLLRKKNLLSTNAYALNAVKINLQLVLLLKNRAIVLRNTLVTLSLYKGERS